MDLINHINQNFHDSIHTKQMSVDMLAENIANASQAITHTLLAGNKILACANGSDGIHPQNLCCRLLNISEQLRPGLPAVNLNADANTLTAIATQQNPHSIFARQISALGLHGDILVVFSSEENADAVEQAIQAAHDREMRVLALTGHSANAIAANLNPADIEIRVPSDHNTRISEVHQLVIHCLCDLIDQQLLGQ